LWFRQQKLPEIFVAVFSFFYFVFLKINSNNVKILTLLEIDSTAITVATFHDYGNSIYRVLGHLWSVLGHGKMAKF